MRNLFREKSFHLAQLNSTKCGPNAKKLLFKWLAWLPLLWPLLQKLLYYNNAKPKYAWNVAQHF